MTYFNMIKIIESTGVGLLYGLRFYGFGQLSVPEMVTYVQVSDETVGPNTSSSP